MRELRLFRLLRPIMRMKVILTMLIVSAAVGFIIDYASYKASRRELPVQEFTATMQHKQRVAQEIILSLMRDGKAVNRNDELLHISSLAKANGIEARIYNGDILIYWTGNEINADSIQTLTDREECYYQASNYHLVVMTAQRGSLSYVAMIKIKSSFHPDEMRLDHFESDFKMPPHVGFCTDMRRNSYPIVSITGEELFRLTKEPFTAPNPTLKTLCGICWAIFAVFYILLFVRLYSLHRAGKITDKRYALNVVCAIGFVILSSVIGLPSYVWQSSIFKQEYYHTPFASSLGIAVLYTISVATYYWLVIAPYLDKKKASMIGIAAKPPITILLSALCALTFIAMYTICKNFIYHSSFDISVSYVQDLRPISVFCLTLVIFWFSLLTAVAVKMLDFAIRGTDEKARKKSMVIAVVTCVAVMLLLRDLVDTPYIVLFMLYMWFAAMGRVKQSNKGFVVVILIAFFVINLSTEVCISLCRQRNSERMTELSRDLTQGDLFIRDDVAEGLMSGISSKLKRDYILRAFLADTFADIDDVKNYVRNTYRTGFWERYDIDAQIRMYDEPLAIKLDGHAGRKYVPYEWITTNCDRIRSYKIYRSKDITLPLSYIAVLEYGVRRMYLCFYPSIYYRGTTVSGNELKYQKYLPNTDELSVAKYTDGKLRHWTGHYHYPPSSSLINYSNDEAYSYAKGEHLHYVTKFRDGGFMVASVRMGEGNMYVILVSSLMGIFIIFYAAWFVIHSSMFGNIRKSIFTRMMLLMQIPLIAAFIAMAWFSFTFFIKQYAVEQEQKMTTKLNAVQSNLQSSIGLRRSLDKILPSELTYNIQNLSSVLQTDIIIFDNDGIQYSSTADNISGASSNQTGHTHLMSPDAKFTTASRTDINENIRGEEYKTAYTYLFNSNNERMGYIQVLDKNAAMAGRTQVFNFLVIVMDAFLVIILLAIFFIWLINRSVSRPLEEISQKFDDLSLTSHNPKIDYQNQEDEIGILVSRYNSMVDQLHDSAEKLAKSERETAWREMARNIAHEIKNPLTPMKLSVQMAQRKQETDPEHFAEYFAQTSQLLVEQIENLARIASEFSDFAKVSAAKHMAIDVAKRLRSAVELYKNNPEGVILHSTVSATEPAFILGDDKQMMQVFNNLIRNAIQAIPEDKVGIVDISLTQDEHQILIKIKDNGIGVSDAVRDKLFEPNFTTKNSGMGLGLAITKSIITASRGTIWFENNEDEGATFFISFPTFNEQKEA